MNTYMCNIQCNIWLKIMVIVIKSLLTKIIKMLMFNMMIYHFYNVPWNRLTFFDCLIHLLPYMQVFLQNPVLGGTIDTPLPLANSKLPFYILWLDTVCFFYLLKKKQEKTPQYDVILKPMLTRVAEHTCKETVVCWDFSQQSNKQQ